MRYAEVATFNREQSLHAMWQAFRACSFADQQLVENDAGVVLELLRTRYDDGGYSGGSTDRPALQRLLSNVKAGKIDVIVVYKVDRLTRSLADFAKLVELFDGHCPSFRSLSSSIPRPRWAG